MANPTTPQSQGAPPVTGQTQEKKEVTPRTFTEEEFLKAVSDRKANEGRLKVQLEAVIKERDSFKVEVEKASALVNETKAEIADLQEDYKLAIADNADATEISKIKKDLRAKEAKLNAEVAAKQKALDAEREQWAGTVAETQEANFQVDTFEIAEDYEGGDWGKLKALCIKSGVKKKEDIQELAEVLWTKKGKEKEAKKEESFIPDSGVTHGGGVNWGSMAPKDRVIEADKRLRKK